MYTKGNSNMNKTVIEYLEGYFDGQLNESISDDNIMEAFNELLETADAVAEYINELRMPGVIRKMRARRVADRKQTSSNILGVRSAAETLGLAKGDLARSNRSFELSKRHGKQAERLRKVVGRAR
jgi:hypothetical protein